MHEDARGCIWGGISGFDEGGRFHPVIFWTFCRCIATRVVTTEISGDDCEGAVVGERSTIIHHNPSPSPFTAPRLPTLVHDISHWPFSKTSRPKCGAGAGNCGGIPFLARPLVPPSPGDAALPNWIGSRASFSFLARRWFRRRFSFAHGLWFLKRRHTPNTKRWLSRIRGDLGETDAPELCKGIPTITTG